MNRSILKTSSALLICFTFTLISQNKVYAGDKEWATVGKILTGALGVVVVNDILNNEPCYVKRPVYNYHHKPRKVIVVKEYNRRHYYTKYNRSNYRKNKNDYVCRNYY